VAQVKISRALWTRLDEIDGKTIVAGAERENWRYEARWQAENHPDREIRAMWKTASTKDDLTRKDARLLAAFAHFEHLETEYVD